MRARLVFVAIAQWTLGLNSRNASKRAPSEPGSVSFVCELSGEKSVYNEGESEEFGHGLV